MYFKEKSECIVQLMNIYPAFPTSGNSDETKRQIVMKNKYEDSTSSWFYVLAAMIVLDSSLLFYDVTHNNCFVFAVFLVSLHGD